MAQGKCPPSTNYVTEPGDIFQGNMQRLLHMPPQAPEPALRLQQLGCPGASKAGEVESGRHVGAATWRSPHPSIRQSIREGCQTLHGLERLYAKMPRAAEHRTNKIEFACAKPTNYQMKCQRLCMW